MIQRIQTVFLLLVVVLQSLLLSDATLLYTGKAMKDGQAQSVDVFVDHVNFVQPTSSGLVLGDLTQIITPLNYFIIALAAISIFLFRRRARQLLLCRILFGLNFLYIIIGAIIVFKARTLLPGPVQDSYQLHAFLSIPSLFFIMLAARGIRKDEELVRSADRFR